MTQPFRIAAIVTTFFPNSHASALVSKFLHGFATDEGPIAPRTQQTSLFMGSEEQGNQTVRHTLLEYQTLFAETARYAFTNL